jgi:hypothetical protein
MRVCRIRPRVQVGLLAVREILPEVNQSRIPVVRRCILLKYFRERGTELQEDRTIDDGGGEDVAKQPEQSATCDFDVLGRRTRKDGRKKAGLQRLRLR